MARYGAIIRLDKPLRKRQPQNLSLNFPQANTKRLTPSQYYYQPGSKLFSTFHDRHQNQDRRYHYRRQEQRSTAHNRLKISRNNPYDVLGIPRNSSADTVKRKFLQLALRHHPDTNDNNRDTKPKADNFVKIRDAFERIKQEFANRNREYDVSSTPWFTEQEFDAWFFESTGQRMDAATRREVMHVYRYVKIHNAVAFDRFVTPNNSILSLNLIGQG
jgi:hypothetical protein